MVTGSIHSAQTLARSVSPEEGVPDDFPGARGQDKGWHRSFPRAPGHKGAQPRGQKAEDRGTHLEPTMSD